MEANQRNCPECKKIMNYSIPASCRAAEKKNLLCLSCSKKGDRNPQHGNVGDKNPFYNKKHTNETKEFLKQKRLGQKHTEEFKKSHSKLFSGQNNLMYGKTVYNVWLQKYGYDIANEKLKEFKLKQSNNSKGEKNPMYGKPSPQGSGNGWSGWYKGWFFRSIHELSFMINVIERFNFKWVTGEKKTHVIQYYDFNNNVKNYFPDFILNEKYIIEIKPKRLFNSQVVQIKVEAAKKYCQIHGLKFKLISPNIIKKEIVKSKIENEEIVFMDKYLSRVEEWIRNN